MTAEELSGLLKDLHKKGARLYNNLEDYLGVERTGDPSSEIFCTSSVLKSSGIRRIRTNDLGVTDKRLKANVSEAVRENRKELMKIINENKRKKRMEKEIQQVTAVELGDDHVMLDNSISVPKKKKMRNKGEDNDDN